VVPTRVWSVALFAWVYRAAVVAVPKLTESAYKMRGKQASVIRCREISASQQLCQEYLKKTVERGATIEEGQKAWRSV